MRHSSFLVCIAFASLLAASAQADTVYVKYQGPVDLEGFDCTAGPSSLVHRICYRSDAQYLVVLLDQTYYHYCRIPESTVNQWRAAPSLGKFYNASIKGSYDCRLGGIPES